MKKQVKTEQAKSLQELLAEIRQEMSKPRRKKRKPRKRTYEYRPCLISYLDILGMKDLLREAGEDANTVAEVLERFRDFYTPMKDQKILWQSTFVNFSDLGLRVVPVLTDANIKHRLGGFFHEVMDLGFIQVNLVNRGILVRGSLTLGLICHAGGLVFGSGLVEVHELESKVAKYPRIIVSNTALEALKEAPVLRAEGNSFKEEMSYLKSFLRKDVDGVWFLDYLAHVRSESDNSEEYALFLRRHKELIEKQRQEVLALPRGTFRKSRLEKLKWLISLHRQHIAELDASIFFKETNVRIRSLQVRHW